MLSSTQLIPGGITDKYLIYGGSRRSQQVAALVAKGEAEVRKINDPSMWLKSVYVPGRIYGNKPVSKYVKRNAMIKKFKERRNRRILKKSLDELKHNKRQQRFHRRFH